MSNVTGTLNGIDDKQERTKDSVKFLEADFNQCFEEMRHLDTQTVELCKYAFFAYASVTPVAVGLYQFGLEKGIELNGIATIILGIGLIVGLFMFGLAVRNRIYFVKVTRYVNEIRDCFLKESPMGFENKTEMYRDWHKPAFYNWHSSQVWFSYMVGLLNSVLLAALIYMNVECSFGWRFLAVTLGALGLFGAQVVTEVVYLKQQDRKSEKKNASRTGGTENQEQGKRR
jgi:hypothetical protein